MAPNVVLLFGPQALSFSAKSFSELRTAILDDAENKWVIRAVSELVTLWDGLVPRFPKLSVVDGERRIQQLIDWLDTGNIAQSAQTLPNVLLSPLVVIAQLTQFTKYLRLLSSDDSNSGGAYANLGQNPEVIGFCTGLLSALAVATATSKAQFEQNATTAIRLATLIGAFVDEQEINGPYKASRSFATVWNSISTKEGMRRIIKEFPEAYISVLYDENRATVTTAASSATLLYGRLRAADIIATEVNLCGRFHSDCYTNDIDQILALCDSDPTLQFPRVSQLATTIRSHNGSFMDKDKLHHFAVRGILVEQSQWYEVFSGVCDSTLADKEATVVGFGPERCVPPSLLRSVNEQVVYMSNEIEVKARLLREVAKPQLPLNSPEGYSNNDIAVVGFALRVAGADDPDEFWQLLCKGESQHVEITPDKISFETHWRKVNPKRKWFGNFIRDPEAFDHRFFKKSPREVVSQDPQQRLMLQVAYQAVEQSGYFHTPEQRVGCFLGVCATDYENNIACHEPNAFSATGNLRSFIAGKISHYFGWTGPSMTIDSACSASAVSIHMACRAILGGECTAALAGGVNIMTNPLWFQNLAGASFLSPTGACKPFDAQADGYCRGEGIAAVFVKKMSQAVIDGDVILGCIASTAVYQNENSTPIFVPNSPSLSSLFADVTQNGGLSPSQITVVEAHGTGTPVGDPAEYESILRVFGGSVRQSPMSIGSVKGLVGHTEGASGVVALIKILLMIQEGKIPPQASFHTLSPHIKASPADMMEIATSLTEWNVDYRAALINNYGASGSNASLIITQSGQPAAADPSAIHAHGLKHPFWLTGMDERSIQSYAIRLRRLIQSKTVSARYLTLSNISFNQFRQSNRNLDKGLIFAASSLPDLEARLTGLINKTDDSLTVAVKKAERPVILCFGGQISTYVGLDRRVYDSIRVLRGHLDSCNSIIQGFGLCGLYPQIFERNPIEDTVSLQTMLFALQYSVARTWVDCGVKIAAVVGHSFGELTALCISGALTVHDALKVIAARARLVQSGWGSDRGSMLAVEGDLSLVLRLLGDAHCAAPEECAATIACYNRPRSYTLAGSTKSIDTVLELSSRRAEFSSLRTKRLKVTNAFHSVLVEPILDDLRELGKMVTFHKQSIHLERATELATCDPLSAEFFAEHMRNPVYFSHAVQRLAEKHPAAIYLEAGSNSTITAMASRALVAPATSYFQAVNILDGSKGMDNIVDMCVSLWKQGLRHTFWPHHTSQAYEYGPILMPVCQFEKTKHWLERKEPQEHIAVSPTPVVKEAQEELPNELCTLIGYQDAEKSTARFRVNTMIKKYEDFVSGHLIAQTAPICPATLEMAIAIEALRSLRPELSNSMSLPRIQDVENQSPICVDPSRALWLDLEARAADGYIWSFKLVSTGSGPANTLHASGVIAFMHSSDPLYRNEFSRYERLVGHQRCLSVLNSPHADDIIQGRNIYKSFADVVDYAAPYRGLQKLVGKGNESAGRVTMKHAGERWLDIHLTDSFSQVGGIWVNCMTDRSPTDMFIATGFDQWIRSPNIGDQYHKAETWDIFAIHHIESEKTYLTDIFIFEATTGVLAEIILGINYAKVSKHAMSKMLQRLTPSITKPSIITSAPSKPLSAPELRQQHTPKASKAIRATSKAAERPDLAHPVKAILAELAGLEVREVTDSTELADIGIDSLMGMELAKELEQKFKCSFSEHDLIEVTSVKGLIQCIESATGPAATSSAEDDDDASSQTNGSLSDSATSLSEAEGRTIDLAGFLSEFLGVGQDDIKEDTVLRDLGVDSLLSTELLADLATKFDLHLPDEVTLEEVTVGFLNRVIPGKPAISEIAAFPGSDRPSPTKGISAANLAAPVVISHKNSDLSLPPNAVLEAFSEVKNLTDQFIADHGCAAYMDTINPKQVQMSIALIIEAFEELGCSLRTSRAGQKLNRIKHLPQHGRLVEYLYLVLERDGRLINTQDGNIERTSIAAPRHTSQELLKILMQKYPDHGYAHKLTYFAGKRLADVLTGKSDGIKLIFGTEEGRDLVTGLYGDSMLNRLSYRMMEDFLTRLVAKLPLDKTPLRILEMGAGTGGTTKLLVPVLASLNIPVEYTYTDLSPSFTAAARKKFKHYTFMKFRVHDIEKPPADDLIGSQHIIIASNAVHATHNLVESTKNIRKALRPDGFLMMLEMTQTLVWIDIIFGLLEGWWLFDDGRRHAIAHQSRWEQVLQSVGYGHIDWTDGHRPEAEIQRVIIAMASGLRYDRCPTPPLHNTIQLTDTGVRQAVIDEYVRQYSQGFTAPVHLNASESSRAQGQPARVLLTGATGSLGSHLVEHLANLPNVSTVFCLNRQTSSMDPARRQLLALESRGILLAPAASVKLRVFETDTSKPLLGLSREIYNELVGGVTHIIHNAWPMSGKRPVKGFEQQFRVMRNLLDFARDISCQHTPSFQVSFQFVSSIATVGHYPLHTGQINVPEDHATIESILPNGYGDAKFTCERLLDETLHRFPRHFRAMAVRLGQISGSKTSGYWNPQEHLSFLIKSCQTLRVLPDFDGLLSWTPVNDVAATLGDLLLGSNPPYPIYHIDNPVRQPWSEMIPVLADSLDIPRDNLVPFTEWTKRVRSFAGSEVDNPAIKLIDFLDDNFLRMSCGGLLLETTKAREHSPTLAQVQPVHPDIARSYITAWRRMGFLR